MNKFMATSVCGSQVGYSVNFRERQIFPNVMGMIIISIDNWFSTNSVIKKRSTNTIATAKRRITCCCNGSGSCLNLSFIRFHLTIRALISFSTVASDSAQRHRGILLFPFDFQGDCLQSYRPYRSVRSVSAGYPYTEGPAWG